MDFYRRQLGVDVFVVPILFGLIFLVAVGRVGNVITDFAVFLTNFRFSLRVLMSHFRFQLLLLNDLRS